MISKSGYDLLQPDAIESVKHDLIPLARLVTPNLPEAERLTGRLDQDDRGRQDRSPGHLHGWVPRAVLIKGGIGWMNGRPTSSSTGASSRFFRGSTSRPPIPTERAAPMLPRSPRSWRWG